MDPEVRRTGRPGPAVQTQDIVHAVHFLHYTLWTTLGMRWKAYAAATTPSWGRSTSLSRERARNSLDRTVPMEIPVSIAISS